MTDDRWTQVRKELEGTSIKWNTPGQELTARVLEIVLTDTDDDGNIIPRLTLEAPDGPRKWWVTQREARRLMAEDPPKVGDVIWVKYVSDKPVGGGHSMKVFQYKRTPAQPVDVKEMA
jgi:hypothetical protein